MNNPRRDHMAVSEFPHLVTLQDWLDRGGVPTIRQTVNLVGAIAQVLSVAHTKGVVHGGVMPMNVVLVGGEMGRSRAFTLHGLRPSLPRQVEGRGCACSASDSPRVIGASDRGAEAEDLAQLAILAEELLGAGFSRGRLVPRPAYQWPPTTRYEVQSPGASAAVRAVLVRAQARAHSTEPPFRSANEFASALQAAVLEQLRPPVHPGMATHQR